MSKTHELKCWPEYFKAVESGEKTFEVRSTLDREFKVGDILYLREWDNEAERYTGNELLAPVTYVLEGGDFGIEHYYCVMGLGTISKSAFCY